MAPPRADRSQPSVRDGYRPIWPWRHPSPYSPTYLPIPRRQTAAHWDAFQAPARGLAVHDVPITGIRSPPPSMWRTQCASGCGCLAEYPTRNSLSSTTCILHTSKAHCYAPRGDFGARSSTIGLSGPSRAHRDAPRISGWRPGGTRKPVGPNNGPTGGVRGAARLG